MTEAALRAAFASASLDFHVAIGCRATDIIGSAHVIFAHRTRISALQVSMEMDDLRKAMIELNAAFTRLDLAHSAMTVGSRKDRSRSPRMGNANRRAGDRQDKDMTIRGEKFQVVTMDRHELGFTSQVGKTWELWMAYRELHCNCKDEGGTVFIADQAPKPVPGVTRVIVGGDDFRAEHDRRSSFILLGDPMLKLENCEVHVGESRGVFYRGILVHRLPQAETSRFTYNITGSVELTEDRTAKHPFMFPHMIASSILQADDESFIRDVVAVDNKFYEHHFPFHDSAWGAKPKQPFLNAVEKSTQHAAGRTSLSAQTVYRTAKRERLAPATTTLVGVESEMLTKAVKFCHTLGFPVDEYPVIVTDALGPNILGMAENDRIYVSRLAFMQGTKRVAGTLIEEFVHLRYKYEDESRGMQEFLLDRLVSLGEQMSGEPL